MVAQAGFDEGFPIGVRFGLRIGRILGSLELFAALTPTALASEVKKRAYQELDFASLARDQQIEDDMRRRAFGSPAGNLLAQQEAAGNGYRNPNLGYHNIYSLNAVGFDQAGQTYPFRFRVHDLPFFFQGRFSASAITITITIFPNEPPKTVK